MVRDNITASLYGAAFIGNNVLRVMLDAMAGLAHHVLRYIDWLSKQLLPDTAEHEWLDRHGDIWLVNADGTTGRKQATFAQGTIMVTGVAGTLVPNGSQLTGNNIGYETTADIVIGEGATNAPVRALDAGVAGNEATALNFTVVLPGVDSIAEVAGELTGGTDVETDSELRARVLKRIRQPPQGGAAYDYEHWALAVPGVTRAWCAPLEMGVGTVTVRVMMDDLRADNDGFPYEADLVPVKQYIDTMRPVAVEDFWVLAPLKQFIDVRIAKLDPDTPEVRASIEASLKAMLWEKAKPGQTIFASWKSYAVMNALQVVSFDLVNNDDDVMQGPGHMAVLGDVYYYD
jgi:uncharacterized phage protein gp47/JayE